MSTDDDLTGSDEVVAAGHGELGDHTGLALQIPQLECSVMTATHYACRVSHKLGR